MDTLGVLLWIMVFASPLITVPLVWQLKGIRKIYRVLVGLLLAVILSFICYHAALEIIFRDGMGPG